MIYQSYYNKRLLYIQSVILWKTFN